MYRHLTNEQWHEKYQNLKQSYNNLMEKKMTTKKSFKMTLGKLAVISWSIFIMASLASAQCLNIGWIPFGVWFGIIAFSFAIMGTVSTVSHYEG